MVQLWLNFLISKNQQKSKNSPDESNHRTHEKKTHKTPYTYRELSYWIKIEGIMLI
jgi:hypothetical protein